MDPEINIKLESVTVKKEEPKELVQAKIENKKLSVFTKYEKQEKLDMKSRTFTPKKREEKDCMKKAH